MQTLPRFFAIFLIQLLLSQTYGQGLSKMNGYCGLFYTNMQSLHKQLDNQIRFYNFSDGENVASIGAQCGNWEAAFATSAGKVHFYLEDIDSISLNEVQLSYAWSYYSLLNKSALAADYKIIIGTETSSNLPAEFFDKILIINSFHEFSDKIKMLNDIYSKLKPDGILYIDETLAKKSGELHIQCKKRIFTSDEIIVLLEQNGFIYTGGLQIDFRKTNPGHKIFAFRKAL
jgi:ubiquinone/menaquinone biosynthesis C-methylase UbiE